MDLIFVDVAHKFRENPKNVIGIMYMQSTTLFYASVFSSNIVFQIERPAVMRERTSQLYTLIAYYAAKIIVELPVLLVLPLV